MGEEKTAGVETLLGNPKKAVLAMSIPLIIAMIAQSANNLIDAVWVAGLGTDALAAVGFVFPLFFIVIGVGNGIGIGTSSAIARHIGREDKKSADATAVQGILLVLIGGIIVTILMLAIERPLLLLLGAGDTIDMCVSYATPIFIATLLFLANGMFSNLLRAEGDAKRAMITQIMAAVINIILDPIFIYDYGLGMGMAGAAWATVIAVAIPFTIMLYWYFVQKKTYITLKKEYIRIDKECDKDILRVGIPSSMEMIMMSIFSMVMNVIIVMAGGTDSVAIYSSTWRLVQILMIPLMAIGGAIVPVCAAAYGARRPDKIKVAYNYSIKVCFIIMIVLVAVTELLADYFVMIFTYSDSTQSLTGDMVQCLRIISLFLPFAAWGFAASGLFQAMGMGMKSLICTVFRNGLQIPVCYVLAITVGSFISLMWGIVAMEIIGSLLAGVWSLLLLRALMLNYTPPVDDMLSESEEKSA